MKKIVVVSFVFLTAAGFAQSAVGVAQSGSTSGVAVVDAKKNNSQDTQKKEATSASEKAINKSEAEQVAPAVPNNTIPSTGKAIKKEGISTAPAPTSAPVPTTPTKQEN